MTEIQGAKRRLQPSAQAVPFPEAAPHSPDAQQESHVRQDIPKHGKALGALTTAARARRPIAARKKAPAQNRMLRARRNAGASDRVYPELPPSPLSTSTATSTTVSTKTSRKHKRSTRLKTLALQFVKNPITGLLFVILLYLFSTKLWSTFSFISRSFCVVPLVSRTNVCHRITDSSVNVGIIFSPEGKALPQRADFPGLVKIEIETLGKLLEESAAHTGLSLEIKKAEMATTDLITVVQHSKLQSRILLVDHLKEFVRRARSTGEGLQKLNARVGGAVDQVVVINDHALRTIQVAQASLPKPNSMSSRMPWTSKLSEVNAKMTQVFGEAMNAASGELTRLILEAQLALQNIHDLEEEQNAIYALVKDEGVIQSAGKDSILADVWAFFGGNRGQPKDLDERMLLLKEVGSYRNRANAQIDVALHTLGEMAQGLEELRARIAAPRSGIFSVVGDIPIDLQIRSIQVGIERLIDHKKRAKTMQEAVVRVVLDGVGAIGFD